MIHILYIMLKFWISTCLSVCIYKKGEIDLLDEVCWKSYSYYYTTIYTRASQTFMDQNLLPKTVIFYDPLAYNAYFLTGGKVEYRIIHTT